MSWKRLASPNHWLNLALPPEDANLDSSTQAGPWRPFGQTWWSVSGDGSKFQLCWTLPVAWLGILCLSFPSQSQLAENASQSDFLREKNPEPPSLAGVPGECSEVSQGAMVSRICCPLRALVTDIKRRMWGTADWWARLTV